MIKADWKDYDTYVFEQSEALDEHLLRVRLDVLVLKDEIDLYADLGEIQQTLFKEFNVEYDPSLLADLVRVLKFEMSSQNTHTLNKEDHFEGF